MPYIGNEVGNRFVASKAASVYSGDGSTTAFTLEHAVGSDEDILVAVDGVIQEPSVAYAVSSGTTLTFTAAPSTNSGNNIFVYYLFRTVATVDHPATSALSATSGTFSTNATIAGTLGVTGASTLTGTVTANGDMVLGGATPTLTIGDAGAEDAKIVFDGNAQDYHIGTDDSADTLNIGKGSALGTTTAMTFNANGIVTKPLQPAFRVHKTSAQTASGNMELVTWNTEELDIGGNFASNLFTAPVAGTYLFHLTALTPASTAIETYDIRYTPVGGSDTELMKFMSTNSDAYESLGGSAIRLMGAGEKMGVYLSSTNDTMYGDGNRWSTFFGYLIG